MTITGNRYVKTICVRTHTAPKSLRLKPYKSIQLKKKRTDISVIIASFRTIIIGFTNEKRHQRTHHHVWSQDHTSLLNLQFIQCNLTLCVPYIINNYVNGPTIYTFLYIYLFILQFSCPLYVFRKILSFIITSLS